MTGHYEIVRWNFTIDHKWINNDILDEVHILYLRDNPL